MYLHASRHTLDEPDVGHLELVVDWYVEVVSMTVLHSLSDVQLPPAVYIPTTTGQW